MDNMKNTNSMNDSYKNYSSSISINYSHNGSRNANNGATGSLIAIIIQRWQYNIFTKSYETPILVLLIHDINIANVRSCFNFTIDFMANYFYFILCFAFVPCISIFNFNFYFSFPTQIDETLSFRCYACTSCSCWHFSLHPSLWIQQLTPTIFMLELNYAI